ncbi:MAG: type II secretion system protein [Candidatus Paceibacterota bacterium]|jgi:prepilin-type N-terminal cleavage/methylation domain-containing protein
MKFKKGFTLIELLVVVAIIGILASVVLASLNSARSKGKDASVQSSMTSMRAQAELGVSSSGTYLIDLCGSSAVGGLATLITAVNNITANDVVCAQDVVAGSAGTAWGAAVQLPSSESGTATYFCVDSTGYSGASTVAPATEIGPTGAGAEVACNNA